MRKHFIIVSLVSFFLFGCNDQSEKNKTQKEKNENIQKDSIAKIKAKELIIKKRKKDSITTIEQGKVIGEIRFGMNKNIAKSKINKFKKENRKPYKIMNKTFYDHFIGNFEFSFIRDFYYENELYKIKIIGKPILWENFESEATKEIKAISNVLKTKYGNPNLHYDLEPRYKLKKNYTYLINSWKIGTKEIQVRISDKGTSYNVILIITKPNVENKIKREIRDKEKQETLKGSEVF
ncbi:hypothetical protein [Winogradskyella sp.]|uniref:hypothetical protein n=1 Tax=Winogradskyella sp. TaxID=1883156 RepID=UPI003F6A8564